MRRAFCFSRSCRLYSLSLRRPRPCSPGGYGRFSTGHLGLSHLEPLRKSLVFSRRQSLQSGPVYLANACSLSQTRRRLGGRQPLWGTGVTSWMPWISRPAAWRERMAVSRPEPGPLTKTSTLRTPCSWARRAACSAASWAANGVDLREPLNPTLPDVAHAIVLPWGSVMVTIVLLKLDLMWAWACAMFFFSRRLDFLAPVFFGGKSSSLLGGHAGGRAPPQLLLLRGLLLAGDGLLGPLAGTGVGVGALAAHGQAPAVPDALVAADLDLALDVLLDLTAQVALDLVVGVDPLPEADDLLLGQVADAGVGVDPGPLDRLDGAGPAEAEDVGEADLHPLLTGEVDAGDACHVCSVPPAPAISPAVACGGGCCR